MAALIGVSVKPAAAGSGYTCKVPLDLVAEDGVPPQEGDQVSYSVDGSVQSVDAEDATIKITAINGQPVSEEEANEPPDTDDTGAPPASGSSAAMRPGLAAGAKGGGLGMF